MKFPSRTIPFRKDWSTYTPDDLGYVFFPTEAARTVDGAKVFDGAGLLQGYRQRQSSTLPQFFDFMIYLFTDVDPEAIDQHYRKTNVGEQAICLYLHPLAGSSDLQLRVKAGKQVDKLLHWPDGGGLSTQTRRLTPADMRGTLQDGINAESLLALLGMPKASAQADLDDELRANAPLFDAGSVKERYPDSYGHYDIAVEAYADIFAPAVIRQIYYGNWLRDFNQINLASVVGPPPAQAIPAETPAQKRKRMEMLRKYRPYFTQDAIRNILEILAVREFVQKPYQQGELPDLKNPQSYNELVAVFEDTYGKMTKDIIGIYRPEEHIDNPILLADDTWAYPWLNYRYEHEYQQYFSKETRNAVGPFAGDVEKAHYNDAGVNAKEPLHPRGMKHYILFDTEVQGRGVKPEDKWVTSYYPSAATYLKRELKLAVRYGATQEGYRHLGAAMHTLEDFFAHSNFCEVTLIKLGALEVFPWVDQVEETGFRWEEQEENPAYQVVLPDYEIADDENGPAAVPYLATYIPIVTGRFLMDDTLASIAPKLADGLFELRFKHYVQRVPGERDTYEMLIRALLENHAQPREEDDPGNIEAPIDISREDASKLLKAYDRLLKLQDDLRRFRDSVPLLQRLLRAGGKVGAYIGQTLTIVPKIALHMALKGMHHGRKHKQNEKVGTMGSNPSHTQIAKDLPTHPLNTFAATLAIHAVRDIGQRIQAIWEQQAAAGAPAENIAEIAAELADYAVATYFVHPCKTNWMDALARTWMANHPKEIARSHHPDTLEKEEEKENPAGTTFKKELKAYFESMRIK